MKMVVHVVKKIRKYHHEDVLILLRCDSGFFDQKNFEKFEELGIAYIIGGKIYNDIKESVAAMPSESWGEYDNGKRVWGYVEMGDRREAWDKFRRMIFCHCHMDEDSQILLEFARPDTVVYTNLGLDHKLSQAFREAGLDHYLTGAGVIECYHGRGNDELVNRAVKNFGTEQLPFKRFTPNAAFYYTMLVSYFLFEAFKEDVGQVTVCIGSYATTLRRVIIDTAAKIVRTGGQIIVKFSTAVYEQIRAEKLWDRSLHPTPIFL